MEEHRHRVEEIVEDPATAEALKPWYRYACRRPCFHDEYLAAFNRPNVHHVACPTGIDRISERGPVVDGVEYPVDCIVYATGFEPELAPPAPPVGQEGVAALAGALAFGSPWGLLAGPGTRGPRCGRTAPPTSSGC